MSPYAALTFYFWKYSVNYGRQITLWHLFGHFGIDISLWDMFWGSLELLGRFWHGWGHFGMGWSFWISLWEIWGLFVMAKSVWAQALCQFGTATKNVGQFGRDFESVVQYVDGGVNLGTCFGSVWDG